MGQKISAEEMKRYRTPEGYAQCGGCPEWSMRPVPQPGHLEDCSECFRHCQCNRRCSERYE